MTRLPHQRDEDVEGFRREPDDRPALRSSRRSATSSVNRRNERLRRCAMTDFGES